MANSLKVLFWLHRSKMNSKGFVPLKIRISFQRNKVEKNSGYWILPKHWNVNKQRVKAGNDYYVEINSWINSCIAKITDVSRGIGNESNLHLPSIIESLFAHSRDTKASDFIRGFLYEKESPNIYLNWKEILCIS